MSSPIRTVLADDHPVFLAGMEQLLRLDGGFDVRACCSSGIGVPEAIARERAELVVLDIRMPGMDGLAVLREIRRQKLEVRVVMLTAALAQHEVAEAVRLGANGVVLKEMAPRLLLQCLRKVHAGGNWIEHHAVLEALESALRREAGLREASTQLTPREIDLVRMVAEGLRNRQIAERLHICEGTVKTHLHNVYRKLGLESRVAVRRYAEDKRLIDAR